MYNKTKQNMKMNCIEHKNCIYQEENDNMISNLYRAYNFDRIVQCRFLKMVKYDLMRMILMK